MNSTQNTADKNALPARLPYEDEQYKWDYDDCGVICRYDKETEEWEPMEEHCVACGYRPDECVCGMCSCGEMRHKDEICGHGYADGICCVCPECSAEMKDNESEDE
jgi:hypothetical protein